MAPTRCAGERWVADGTRIPQGPDRAFAAPTHRVVGAVRLGSAVSSSPSRVSPRRRSLRDPARAGKTQTQQLSGLRLLSKPGTVARGDVRPRPVPSSAGRLNVA